MERLMSAAPIKRGDVVYTPDWAAQDMVGFFKPSGSILEPCSGDGAILKHLPAHTQWCEIEKGKDFLWGKKLVHRWLHKF